MRKQQRRPVSTPCVQWQAQLASLHRNDLLPREREALRVHLLECSACAQAQADYRAMDAALRSLPPVAPLPQLPRKLAEAVYKQQRGTRMLKDDTPIKGITGDLEVIDLDAQRAKSVRKGQRKPMFSPGPERYVSRPVRVISSLVAVLVVVVLAGGAFLLFSDRSQNGPDSSVVGGQVPSNANVLFTSPEIPGQVKKANIYAVNPQNGLTYWKATLKTKLTSSELIPHQGVLFAPGYDGNQYALSAKTGQVLWKYSVKNDPAPGIPSGVDNVPIMPIADGSTVYFGAGSGFYALNIRDGKLLWHVKTPTSCKPPVASQQGNSMTVEAGPTCPNVLGAVANGRVYGFFDGLYAFDASNGKQLWRDPQPQFRGAGSVVVSGKYVYTMAGSHLNVLNATDGKKVNVPALSSLGQGTGPLEANGVIYYSSDTQLTAIRGTAVLWKQKYSNTVPVAFSQETLFVETLYPLESASKTVGAYFYALDASTGKIKWHWGEKSSDGASWEPGYPTSMDGKLYFFFSDDSRGANIVNGLWVLHDGKRDFYPLQD